MSTIRPIHWRYPDGVGAGVNCTLVSSTLTQAVDSSSYEMVKKMKDVDITLNYVVQKTTAWSSTRKTTKSSQTTFGCVISVSE